MAGMLNNGIQSEAIEILPVVACELTDAQKNLILALAAEINSTCTYNISVGPAGCHTLSGRG